MKKVIVHFAQKSISREQVDTTDYIESLNTVTKEDWTDIVNKLVSSKPDVKTL